MLHGVDTAKKLVPTWEELATKNKGKFHVAKIDCTVEEALATRFGIRGFPTIKFYHDGQLYDYKNPRKVDAFEQFVATGYSEVKPSPFPSNPDRKKSEPEPEPEPQPDEVHALPIKIFEPVQEVVVLTGETFAEKTSVGPWFVKFYAPWCGHCKRLAPIWDELATKTNNQFNVARVDCTVEKSVCSAFNIRGYPTLKLIKDGQIFDYSGKREIDAFLTFLAPHINVDPQPSEVKEEL